MESFKLQSLHYQANMLYGGVICVVSKILQFVCKMLNIIYANEFQICFSFLTIIVKKEAHNWCQDLKRPWVTNSWQIQSGIQTNHTNIMRYNHGIQLLIKIIYLFRTTCRNKLSHKNVIDIFITRKQQYKFNTVKLVQYNWVITRKISIF